MIIWNTLITHYVWLAAWLGSCLLVGVACWGKLGEYDSYDAPPWPNPELAIFLSVCTGLAVHILALIVLALLGMLHPVSIVATFMALSVASLVYLYHDPVGWNQFVKPFRMGRFEWLKVLPVLLVILPWILRPLGPPYGMDALTYHLPYAQFYLDQGGLAVNENLRFPLHTHNVNLLYSVALLRPGTQLAQALHASMGFLALLGIYGIARHWYGWLAAILAVSGMLLLQEFRNSFSYAFADNGVLLYATAAFLAMALWAEIRQQRLLWFCALFAGTAMGSKYFGALFTIPLGLTLLWFSRDFKLLVRFAAVTAVFGLFWYLRSWWISGNPVHPFAGDIFGHYLWNASELAGNLNELSSWGVDKTWKNFILLPERVYSEIGSFNGAMGHVGVLLGAFYFSFVLTRFQKPIVLAIQITCLAYLLFWFWTSQVVRYLMLIVPLMSLSTVSAFAGAVLHFLPVRVLRTPAVNYSLLAAVMVAMGWAGVIQLRHDVATMPLTPESHAKILIRDLPAYELGLAASADPRIGKGPLLQFQVPEIRYFFTGSVAGDWMGVHGWSKYGHVEAMGNWFIDDSATLYEKVTREGFTAVALRKNPPHQFKPQPLPSYLEHFEIVFETDDGVLMIPRQNANF